MTYTGRRRFPILIAAIAALAVAMSLLFSPVQAQEGSAPGIEPDQSVSEGDTDLPNDNSTPGRVAVGGSATGAIGTPGDQDRFAVELEAGRTYRFDLTGSPGGGGTLPDTYFRALYNSEGRYQPDSYNDDFEGGRDSRVAFTPPESGTYYARVSGDRDETGSYTLSVTEVPSEPPARPTGVIGASSQDLVKLFWTDPQDGSINGYRIMRREPRADDSGQFVAVNEDTGSAETTYTDDTVKPDRVYVYQVRAIGSGGVSEPSRDVKVRGTAEVGQGFREGATDLPAAATTSGVVVVDGYGARGAIAESDTDWFAVELKVGRTYRIDMKGAILVAPRTYADPELTLHLPQINAIYDADGDYLFNTWSRDESSAHHLFRVTFHAHAGGTYYIAASGESFEAGGYELRVIDITRDADEHAADPSRTGTVAVGGSTTGKIDFSGDRDWFKVTLAAGTEYQVDLEGQATGRGSLRDPVLRGIFDADGNEIPYFRDDDGGEGSNARVTFTPGANGVYYVAAGSFGDYLEGTYTLSVKEVVEEDDDGSTPVAVTAQFDAATYTATEGGSAVTVTVNLSADPERSVTIPITAAGAGGAGTGDYSLSANSVTIDSGDTSATFTVTATDDSADDDGESVNLSFGTLPDEVSPGTQSTATVNLTDNDHPQVTAEFGAATYTAAEGGSAVTVTVNLSADPERSVTIPVTAAGVGGAGTGDYSLSATSVTIPSGSTSATFTVTATDDSADDDDESVTLSFGTLPDEVSPGTQSTATVNLTDNDHPQVTAEFGAATYTAAEGGSAVTVTVNLSADPERSVTIPVTAAGVGGAGTGDYSLSATSVTIPSGSTSATFTVTAVDDSADDDDESVTLSFGTLPDEVSPGTQSTATVNLTDNDHPQVTAEFGAATYTAAEGGSAVTVTVNLSADPERSVTIPVTAAGAGGAGTGDYSLSATSVTIPSGSTSATFTVTAVDDSADDDDESVTLSFGTLPDEVSPGTQSTATVNLTDNDHPQVTAEFGAATYTATEGGSAVTVTVNLSADPERSVTIPIVAAGADGATAGDYTLSANSVTIPSGSTSATFTVTAVDDSVDDDGESVTLSFGTLPDEVSPGTQSTATVNLTETDSTPPSASAAQVSADGTTIDIVFDEDLDATDSAPAATAFKVTVDGGTPVTPDNVDFHASDADTFTLTMAAAAAIAAGATVTVAYDKPEDNPLKDAAGNEVATFTGQAAANRLDAPAEVRASAGNGRVDVEWDAPASGDAPSGYQVQWKAPSDGAYDATRSATVVAGVAEYAITGLTNGDPYVVAVRALDDSNNLVNEAAESPEVTVGQPKAVADLTAAGRHEDFRVDWDAPDERGEGFAQDDEGNPVLVYRVSWMQASETTQVRCLTATAANRFKDGTSNPGDGDTYQIKVEARFETDPAVDESVTGCADQTGFGPESSTSATVGRATTGDSDHAALVAGLEAAVTVREQQQPWMRTAWEQLKTAPFLGVQAKDRDRDDYGAFHSRDCTLSSDTFETDALDSCESGKFQMDVDWDLMPDEEFEYILARELGQTWLYNTGIHDAQSRSPVGRALLYFSQQDFKGDDSKHIVCTFDAMADVIAHVAVGTPSTALGSYGTACFTDGRTEPAQLTEVVVVHALHPSGTDPDGNDTTSSWFTDTYATGAEAWVAVESITPREQKDPPDPLVFPWSRGMVVILLQDEFGGYCSALVTNGAAFGTAFFDNVGGGNDVTDPWNTFGCEPGAPTGVTVSEPNSQKIIDVAWTAPTKSGAPITDYTVQWRTTTQTWAQASSQTIDASPPEFQISVNPSERYVVRVRAVNSIGDGEWGAEVTSDAADDDANLTALSVDGTSVEDFDKDTTGYSLSVAGTVARVTFVAAASHDDATVAYSVNAAGAAAADSVTDGHQVDLDGGSNEVVITVTAQDGTTTKDYTVTVHRAAVPHDWSLRPDGVLIGGMFRLLFITSTTRDGWGTDIDPYDAHVQSALAADGAHEDIRDYSPRFKALAGVADGTDPRTHTGTHPVDDGSGVAIWWLNGPLAAADNDDFYEYNRATSSFCSRADDDDCYDGWAHSDPAYLESGEAKNFISSQAAGNTTSLHPNAFVWTGTGPNGERAPSKHLGSSGGIQASTYGVPDDNESVWSDPFPNDEGIGLSLNTTLGLYGLSDTLYVEPPDAPYATVAAITSTPANGTDYRAGETITATVTFSEAVEVDTTLGTPSLGLGIGSNTRDADYQSTDSTGMVLTFAYPVVGDDEDLDGIAVAMGALKLNGGAITGATGDHNGVAAVLTHAAITADENQKVDGDLDAIAPSVDSATVSTDGTTIDIVFDEDLDATGSAPAASAFDVTVDGGTAVDPMSVDFHTSDADTITLTMATADTIAAGATVTVAYDQPTTNPLKDAADNEVADFTQTAPNRPAAPVVSLTAGDEKLTATWAAPANGGSAITGYTVEHKVAGAADSTYVAVTRADAAALTETITGLTNNTEYTVRVRAGNDAGDGPWSAEASETPVSGSSDADLSALTVDDGTGAASVDGFDPADTGYSLSVAGMVARVTVAATASHSKATVEIAPADADAGTEGHQVALAGGPNVVTITVTAEDTTSTEAYTVTVHRAAVPHGWSLRPEGVPTGETFRVLIVTSTRRDATSGDIADYDAHVRSALANRGHTDIQDYGPLFKALAATKDGAHPRSHTGTDPDPDVDGPGEEIWWLNGPKAADDYADFYDYDSVNGSDCDLGDDCFDGWNHSNPARTESGDPKTFYLVDDTSEDIEDRVVWTGTWLNGRRSTGDTRSLGTTTEVSGQRFAFVGGPYQKDTVWVIPTEENAAHALVTSNSLGLYGLSDTLYVEPPDAPYATVAELQTAPENGTDFETNESIVVYVTFSEAVQVSSGSNLPRLPLQIGDNVRHAVYQPGDGTTTELSFLYKIVDDDQDLDGITIAKFSLDLNGATITGAVGGTNDGVDAALTHTGVVADEDLRVNLPPLITGVEVTSTPQATNANDTYGLGEDIEITVTFSKAVTVTGDVDFGLSVSAARRAPLVRGDGTTDLVFAYTVQATDDDDDGIWIGDHTHATNPTFDLASDQSIMGAVSGLDALLEHDEVGQQNDHKVDGSLTGADATLSALSLSGITLIPAFAPGATAYTATTSLSSTTVTIGISQGQNGATGRIAAPPDADLNESGHQVTLDVGATTITVTVTSSNSDSTRTYTVTVTREVVTDTTAPSAASAQVSTDGMSIDIVFDEDLDATGSAPAALAFQVTVGTASAVNPSSVDFPTTAATTVVLTMTTAIAAGETVSVAYTKPASNALADAASNEVESFTGADEIAAPNRPAAPVVTLSAGDGKLTASWAAPANGGSAITDYDVEWKTATQTWDEAETAGQSDTATSPYEITGLTNGIEHTVRVRSSNAAGDGPWSAEASETPVASVTQVTAEFGAASYIAIEGRGAVTITVTLSADPERSVTIPITVTENGGAGTGDYSLSATSVTIDSGDTSATVTVTATDDDVHDGDGNDENLALGFGTPLPDGVSEGNQDTATVGLIDNEVPSPSEIIPEGTATGGKFRLLFVTSGERDARSTEIEVYNAFVQEAAAAGHADIQDYSSLFRALASTESISARDNTGTTYTSADKGVPIWWLNGPQAADDYADFYDESWDRRPRPRRVWDRGGLLAHRFLHNQRQHLDGLE